MNVPLRNGDDNQDQNRIKSCILSNSWLYDGSICTYTMHLSFPTSREGWKFDLVGLLAILGEKSVEEIATPLTASKLVYLPRLLPAPHALIRPDRRQDLPLNTNARMIGVYSGNSRESVSYFGDILHPVEFLENYSVQFLAVTVDSNFHRVKTRTLAPLNMLTLFSFFLTLGLLAWAIVLEDGCAVVSIVLVSTAGSATSLASRWFIELPHRVATRQSPPGDLVVLAQNGTFIIVKCTEEAARSLYWAPHRCVYLVNKSTYQVLISTGTAMLMFGIVLMATCMWVMQVALGASYLLLNGLYLLAALSRSTPRKRLWDLSEIKCSPIRHKVRCQTYTSALWQAILETKTAEWVRASRAAPATDAWNQWLQEAEKAAQQDWRLWEAEKRLTEILIQSREMGEQADRVDNMQAVSQDAEIQLKQSFKNEHESQQDEENHQKSRRRATALI